MSEDNKALEILASRLAESVLMDWDKEEQVRLAKEVACECHKNQVFVSLVKRMREAQKELDTCSIGDYGFRQHCATQLEREVDEYLKKMEE